MRDDLAKNIVGILREAEAESGHPGHVLQAPILLGRPFSVHAASWGAAEDDTRPSRRRTWGEGIK